MKTADVGNTNNNSDRFAEERNKFGCFRHDQEQELYFLIFRIGIRLNQYQEPGVERETRTRQDLVKSSGFSIYCDETSDRTI
jgi:hypothetical protein